MFNKKGIILYGGIFILLIHFALLISYLVKPNGILERYSYPYFHQSWNLFVPPPNCNYKLYVYSLAGQSPPNTHSNVIVCFDIMNEIIQRHQSNRLSGYEPLLMGLTNSIHFFEKSAEDEKFEGGKVASNINFLIVEKFAKNYLKSQKKIDIQELKLILYVEPISEGRTRVYFN